MIPLLLIRHAPTEWNEKRRVQGSTDIPLGAAGRAAAAGWRLPVEFEGYRWVSSPLQRAAETARLMGGKPEIEPRLTEMDWGEWEGLYSDELAKMFPEAIEESLRLGVDFRRPGGESPRDVQKRLVSWFTTLEEPMVAFTHQGVINAVHALSRGWDMTGEPPLRFENGHCHLFTIDGEGAPPIPNAGRLNMPLETS